MTASKFTRNADYSQDENDNKGGRTTIDASDLDGEMDEVKSVTDDHADLLDVLLRADEFMVDKFLQGHEFSAQCLTVLSALIGTNTALVWRGDWANSTLYSIGNLVGDSGVIYICLAPHTSAAAGGFVLTTDWEEFVNPASVSLPSQVGHANKVLKTDGSTTSWTFITVTNAPTLAPLASPVFTGVVALPDVNIAGRFNLSVEAVTFSAASQVLNFDTQHLKTIDVTGSYTSVITASNITQGDTMEVHFDNTTASPASLLWDAGWTWMGYKPTSLHTGKKAVLNLRAPTGGTASDVIAMWSVEP